MGTVRAGAAILNVNTLTVQYSRISNNSAGSIGGGGIGSFGTLTVLHTAFSGNVTSGIGGGIFEVGGTATVANSTFSGGSAQYGDGIASIAGTSLTVTNSTFSANSASGQGGGIYNGDTLTITNSTFSGNSGAVGGGILNHGTMSYANTIIASSSGGDCNSLFGNIGTNTHNLVEDNTCSPSLSGDPNLDTLDDNGSPTQTLALLAGSIAINAGSDSACDMSSVSGLDQRGVLRPNGPHCDIGAYEYVDTSAPTVTSFTVPLLSASLNIPIAAFTASDDVGVTGYLITESATPPSAGAAGWTGSAPTTYTVGSDSSYTLYPWAKDASGNVSSVVGSPTSVSVDTSAPTVVSSLRVNLNPTTAASVDFAVTFSEAVTGVDAADFSLTTTGSISGAVISGVSGSGTTYTVTVNADSGAGTIRLDVTDNDSIVDAASNPLGGSGAGNGAFTSGEAYTIDLYRIYLPLVMQN